MMMKAVRHLENRKQLAEEVNNLRHYKTIRYDAGQSMYKVKLILRWIQLRNLFSTLVMLMIFLPISILITIYYNTKKRLGLHDTSKYQKCDQSMTTEMM